MDTQISNFFSRYTAEVQATVEHLLTLQDMRQEAVDRGIVADLENIDFLEYGSLAYLTEAKVLGASGAIDDLTDALDANNRTGWAALYGVIP